MEKPWKVVLAFAGVFLAGAIFGGALAPRWFGWEISGRRGSFRELHMMDRLNSELELTAEQKEKIAPIVSQAEAETRRLRREGIQGFRAVMEKTNTQISAELTPEQKQKLENMRKRFRERMERFRSRDRDREKSPAAPAETK